jgi:hypothetical protein
MHYHQFKRDKNTVPPQQAILPLYTATPQINTECAKDMSYYHYEPTVTIQLPRVSDPRSPRSVYVAEGMELGNRAASFSTIHNHMSPAHHEYADGQRRMSGGDDMDSRYIPTLSSQMRTWERPIMIENTDASLEYVENEVTPMTSKASFSSESSSTVIMPTKKQSKVQLQKQQSQTLTHATAETMDTNDDSTSLQHKKRQQNREACRRLRKKRKQEQCDMQREMDVLKKENRELKEVRMVAAAENRAWGILEIQLRRR